MAVSAARYGGANLTWLLDSLVGAARARDLLLTARAVPGEEAYRMGLLTRYASDVGEAALQVAREVAAQPPQGIRHIKQLLLEGPGRSLRARYEAENASVRSTLDDQPIAEMFSAFFAGRPTAGEV